MGQFLLPDNTPNLVVASTTNVTIAATNNGQPTTMQIGGQQYALSSTLTLTTSGTGANGLDTGALGAIQLWYVYAIVNNSTFVPALIASQSAPSTGPTMPSGYGTAFKLVGAFYTNGSSQVGSIVPISGPAITAWMSYTPFSSWSAQATGAGGLVGQWRRNGSNLEFEAYLVLNATPTGALSFGIPTGLSVNGANIAVANGQTLGTWGAYKSSTLVSYFGVAIYSNSQVFNLGVSGGASSANYFLSATVPASFVSTDNMSMQAFAPISGWNATLL